MAARTRSTFTPEGSPNPAVTLNTQNAQNSIIWDSDVQSNEPASMALPVPNPRSRTPASRARRWINVDLALIIRASRFRPQIEQAYNGSRLMTKPDLQQLRPPTPATTIPLRPKKFVVRLIQEDILTAAHALHLKDPSSKITILNCVDEFVPGGGLLTGSTAQEENICLRTTLHRSLHHFFYPLQQNQVIFSPDILVAKLNSFDHPDGRPLPEQSQYLIDVISCPAVRLPPTTTGPAGHPTWSFPQDRDLMRLKLQTILAVACQRGVKRLILGAFGCGSLRNPTRAVALMIRDLLLGSSNSHSHSQSPVPATTTNNINNNTTPPPPVPPPTTTAAINFAAFGLEEVTIAILDSDMAGNQPTWSAFADVFRDAPGAQLVVPNALVSDIEEVSHHVFLPGGGVSRERTDRHHRDGRDDLDGDGDDQPVDAGAGAGGDPRSLPRPPRVRMGARLGG